MIEVAAGIIRRADGRVLICRRGEGRHHAHLWEFPGGKLEAGESAEVCLARELMEELSLPVTALREIHRSEAEGIVFHFVEGATSAEPCLTEHEALAFVRPREMLRYAFCPADEPVAHALALNDPPLRHFFWDFDGTVMDTYPVGVEAFRRAASALGAQLGAAEVLDLMKRSVPACLREVSAAHGLDRDMLEHLFRAEEARVPVSASAPVAGIPETLRALREAGGHHYLVTHRDRRAVSYLQNAGLDSLFDDLVTAEEGFPRKPQPDSLLHLVHKHGLNPAECVMIGDRPIDTAAGRNAGMLSCLLDEENRFPDDPCELRTARADRLMALLCPAPIR